MPGETRANMRLYSSIVCHFSVQRTANIEEYRPDFHRIIVAGLRRGYPILTLVPLAGTLLVVVGSSCSLVVILPSDEIECADISSQSSSRVGP